MRLWAHLDAQMLDFGTPLAPSWAKKWHPKSPKWRQRWSPKTPGRITLRRLASRITFGTLWVTILTSLGWIWAEFSWIWASFLTDFGAAIAECQSHLARNEITENLKNMQITAEICKKTNATNNADIKTPIQNLQAA